MLSFCLNWFESQHFKSSKLLIFINSGRAVVHLVNALCCAHLELYHSNDYNSVRDLTGFRLKIRPPGSEPLTPTTSCRTCHFRTWLRLWRSTWSRWSRSQPRLSSNEPRNSFETSRSESGPSFSDSWCWELRRRGTGWGKKTWNPMEQYFGILLLSYVIYP